MNTEASSPISLVSLNVEGNKHWERIVPFLEKQKPDVVCLQEMFESDCADLRGRFGMHGLFEPVALRRSRYGEQGELMPWGVCILTRLPVEAAHARYYYGDVFSPLKPLQNIAIRESKKVLVWLTVKNGRDRFTIGTTHFTWSAGGMADDHQRRDVEALLRVLEKIPDIAWCGDLNAPRGGEIFAKFAARYQDCIPAPYTTSIDGSLHKAGPLERMVDGLFTTPQYIATEVALVDGLSDHCALTAKIAKH